MVLKVNSMSQAATSTLSRWSFVYGYTGGPWVNNVEVSHLDLSLLDPTAVVEFVFGRQPIQSNPGSGTTSNYFNAVGVNSSGGNSSGFVTNTTGITETLGQYYVQGGEALQLDFKTPIEAFTITEAWAFTYSIRLVGSTSETADGTYFLNTWFSEA
jgi:hypothetical protein